MSALWLYLNECFELDTSARGLRFFPTVKPPSRDASVPATVKPPSWDASVPAKSL